MRIALPPLAAGLIAAALPVLSPPAHAAERGRISIDDTTRNPQQKLDRGDTVTYAGTGAAIDVAATGNTLQGDGITVTAGSATRAATIGVRAQEGGAATLTNSTVSTLGDGASAHALAASGAGSHITLNHSTLATRGGSSYGAYAETGGRIDISGGSVAAAGDGASGLRASGAGAVITATHAAISTQGAGAGGAHAEADGAVMVTGGSVSSTGLYAPGVSTSGRHSRVKLNGATVSAKTGDGAFLAGGRVEMDGGSLTGASAVLLGAPVGAPGARAAIDIRNATLRSTGAFGYGIDINADGASAVLHNVSVSAMGAMGTGIWMPGVDTRLTATAFDITATRLGLDTRAGQATLTDGTVKTVGSDAYGLYASHEYGTSASITATRVAIDTSGNSAIGVVARLDGSHIHLDSARVTTRGDTAYGLFAAESGATLSAINTVVQTHGARATGLMLRDGATVTLDNTQLATQGANAGGVWSALTRPGRHARVTIANGSRIDTRDGAALLATGANHVFAVSDAVITARAGGDTGTGVLLHAESLVRTSAGVSTVIDSEQITLDATRAVLTGDVLAANGVVDVSLKRGSVLTGALRQQGSGVINSLTLDSASTWNVRNDSRLGKLVNAGTVAFVAPAGAAGFKTLTVTDYTGGGSLVIHTRLDGDASATDRLVIDGGAATGRTAVRVLNVGGAGDQTQQGIRVIQTVNGGVTATDAFRLDAGSTGYRASADTLALNGYDYSLVRGGNGGHAPDWYLTSAYTPPVPGPGLRNVSPESGAYLGNRLASARFFSHSRHDRVPAYAGGDAAAQPDRDGGGDASSSDSPAGSAGRRLWTRVEGRQDSGLRLSQGRVDIDTDSTILQWGADLVHAPLGQGGALYAGLMGGYGDARSTSTSTLLRPGGVTAQARARGKVSGYAVGLYGTAYQDDATRLGAYADTWLQYGRYTNQINSELGAARYRSSVWSASIEAGYAVQPFADGSALGPIVIEPHAQLTYSRYDAQDATLQGTRMRSGDGNTWDSRIGLRLYPHAGVNAPAVRPFLEANWLHRFGNASVRMGPNTLDAALSHDSLELKLGAEGRVSRRVQVSGHVFGQAGSNNQRGYGGMVNAGYRW